MMTSLCMQNLLDSDFAWDLAAAESKNNSKMYAPLNIIVCPDAIIDHWVNEITNEWTEITIYRFHFSKHDACWLTCLYDKGNNNMCESKKILNFANVPPNAFVIVSWTQMYCTLNSCAAENSRVGTRNMSAVMIFSSESVQLQQQQEKTRKHIELRTFGGPISLTQYHFGRLIFDEGQSSGGETSKRFKMTKHIDSLFRWYQSATPVSPDRGVYDLQKMTKILGLVPFCNNKKYWSDHNQDIKQFGDYHLLVSFLQHFMWCHSFEQVKDEMKIPPLITYEIPVAFSALERAYYDATYAQLSLSQKHRFCRLRFESDVAPATIMLDTTFNKNTKTSKRSVVVIDVADDVMFALAVLDSWSVTIFMKEEELARKLISTAMVYIKEVMHKTHIQNNTQCCSRLTDALEYLFFAYNIATGPNSIEIQKGYTLLKHRNEVWYILKITILYTLIALYKSLSYCSSALLTTFTKSLMTHSWSVQKLQQCAKAVENTYQRKNQQCQNATFMLTRMEDAKKLAPLLIKGIPDPDIRTTCSKFKAIAESYVGSMSKKPIGHSEKEHKHDTTESNDDNIDLTSDVELGDDEATDDECEKKEYYSLLNTMLIELMVSTNREQTSSFQTEPISRGKMEKAAKHLKSYFLKQRTTGTDLNFVEDFVFKQKYDNNDNDAEVLQRIETTYEGKIELQLKSWKNLTTATAIARVTKLNVTPQNCIDRLQQMFTDNNALTDASHAIDAIMFYTLNQPLAKDLAPLSKMSEIQKEVNDSMARLCLPTKKSSLTMVLASDSDSDVDMNNEYDACLKLRQQFTTRMLHILSDVDFDCAICHKMFDQRHVPVHFQPCRHIVCSKCEEKRRDLCFMCFPLPSEPFQIVIGNLSKKCGVDHRLDEEFFPCSVCKITTHKIARRWECGARLCIHCEAERLFICPIHARLRAANQVQPDRVVWREIHNIPTGLQNSEILLLNRDILCREPDIVIAANTRGVSKTKVLPNDVVLRQLFPGCKLQSVVDQICKLQENDFSKGPYHKVLAFDSDVVFRKRLYYTLLWLFRQNGKQTFQPLLLHTETAGNECGNKGKINDFISSKTPVILILDGASTAGLHLAAADVVLLCSPSADAVVTLQSQKRAHRFGQTKTVSVLHFFIKASVEQDLYNLMKTKMHTLTSTQSNTENIVHTPLLLHNGGDDDDTDTEPEPDVCDKNVTDFSEFVAPQKTPLLNEITNNFEESMSYSKALTIAMMPSLDLDLRILQPNNNPNNEEKKHEVSGEKDVHMLLSRKRNHDSCCSEVNVMLKEQDMEEYYPAFAKAGYEKLVDLFNITLQDFTCIGCPSNRVGRIVMYLAAHKIKTAIDVTI